MPTYLQSLNVALETALKNDERVIMIGEDIIDPYGGAFKVTRGLSTAFPDRILTTPVSEAGILGFATGMALRGFLPVVEIMFGDFVTLIADQVINHATKLRYMYNEAVNVPIVIRTPMGGRRGYGPTHSQSLEKLFMGTPGLKIIAPNLLSDPGELLLHAVFYEQDPVLFIENKISYTQSLLNQDDLKDFSIKISEFNPSNNNIGSRLPIFKSARLSLKGTPPPGVTVAAYGHMAELVRQAALKLAYEDEIFIEIVVFSQLLPVIISPLRESLQNTHRLLVVEEGTLTSGWGAEVIASSSEQFQDSIHQVIRIASKNTPIPASSTLEEAILPDVDDIVQAVKKMV